MSEPYIARYFPAEGKIKEGDTIRIKDKNSDGVKLKQAGGIHKVEKVDNATGREYLHTDDDMLIPAENAEKVILFLSIKHWEVEPGDNPIKPVGMVSPEAVWVREYDRFDKEEVMLYWQPGGYGSETWNLVRSDYLPSDFMNHTLYTDALVFKIFNRSCKHFH